MTWNATVLLLIDGKNMHGMVMRYKITCCKHITLTTIQGPECDGPDLIFEIIVRLSCKNISEIHDMLQFAAK